MALALVAAVAVGLVACNNSDIKDAEEVELAALTLTPDMDYSNVTIAKSFKIGMICLHGTESTYDLNFINAAKAAIKEPTTIQKTLWKSAPRTYQRMPKVAMTAPMTITPIPKGTCL